MTLAVKYRPQTLDDICGQTLTTAILKQQIEKQAFKNAYLFCGDSGVGKTTAARAFSKAINGTLDGNIELDAASNGNIESIRQIVDSANKRSMFGKYKIFLIDECHAISTAGWQVFLKSLEECPVYTIFIFCTTDPSHIPPQVLNRLQRFNFSQLSTKDIYNRLCFICDTEHFTEYEAGCDYISKMCNGCMRDAITMLEQCADFSTKISIDNVKQVLGDLSYETMISLTNMLIDGRQGDALLLLENMVKDGKDIRQFIEAYISFLLDLTKYIIFKDLSITKIPVYLKDATLKDKNIDYVIGFENNLGWFNKLINDFLTLKMQIKNDPYYVTTIKAYFIKICAGLK